MNTEKEIQNTLKKLLEKYSLDEIDVNTICRSLDIKRQTFYYHFKNIYDVIYSIYCYEKIGEQNEKDINSIVESIFKFLYFKDLDFNTLVAKSNACDVLKEFIASYTNLALLRILDRYNLRINDKKEIARFYSKAICEQCIYYFVNGDYSSKEAAIKISYLFNEDILREVIRKYQNSII